MKKIHQILKKIFFLFILTLFISSCGNTWDSVKRGMTGEKAKSTDEFFVKKKDPLILPPEFDRLPTPEVAEIETQEVLSIEKKIKETKMSEEVSTSSSTTEESILRRIRKQ